MNENNLRIEEINAAIKQKEAILVEKAGEI
jgi:hypothetical protein